MKKIIVYSSETGFTKKYAEAIAAELQIEVIPLSKLNTIALEKDDVVIYGGSLMANMIRDYNKIAKQNIPNLIVFAVGFSEESDEIKEQIKQQNKLGSIPFFYMRGGVNYEKLGFIKRILMKKITGEKKSVDCFDRKYMMNLINYVKTEL